MISLAVLNLNRAKTQMFINSLANFNNKEEVWLSLKLAQKPNMHTCIFVVSVHFSSAQITA